MRQQGPTKERIQELTLEHLRSAMGAARRRHRRLARCLVAMLAAVLCGASLSKVFWAGRGAAELPWDESVRIIGSDAPSARRQAAIEVVRRRILEIESTLASLIDSEDRELSMHAANALRSIREGAR